MLKPLMQPDLGTPKRDAAVAVTLEIDGHTVTVPQGASVMRAAAEGGIASVKANAAADARFDRRETKNGDPYFVLTAANGQIIGKSETYSSKSAMENGITSVATNAPGAAVVDTTG